MSVCNFVYSRDLGAQLWTIFVGVMFRSSKIDASTFEDRCVALRRSMCRPSKIDVTMCRPSKIDVTMCRPSKNDVSTFGDGCVDPRRPMIDVSTFEDR